MWKELEMEHEGAQWWGPSKNAATEDGYEESTIRYM